ncbi:hypothetical protein [Spirosoma aerophilum]
MTVELFVPESKFEEADKMYSAQSIAESGTCKTFFWQNKEYVSVGGMSSFHTGTIHVEAYQVVDLVTYQGALEPLKYNKHHQRQVELSLERGYNAMLVTVGKGKRPVVMIDPRILFKKLEVGKQLSIF